MPIATRVPPLRNDPHDLFKPEAYAALYEASKTTRRAATNAEYTLSVDLDTRLKDTLSPHICAISTYPRSSPLIGEHWGLVVLKVVSNISISFLVSA